MLTGAARETALATVSDALRVKMEAAADRLKSLVLKQPSLDLLAYLWSLLQMKAMFESEDDAPAAPGAKADIEQLLATLEYLHAIWSCFPASSDTEATLDQAETVEIVDLVGALRNTAMLHSLASTSRNGDGEFGRATGAVEFNARATWILIRGNRYQVLEQEFFAFVLAPHEQALRDVYGVGAADVAAGIQAIANAMREGVYAAIATVEEHMKATHQFADERDLTIDEALAALPDVDPTGMADLGGAMRDLLRGGLCNLSRQTRLPSRLLEDLAYKRGDNAEFFAPGDFGGTPLRTLPARVKPLIALDDGVYATDGQFVRDSAYRAIGRGIAERLPPYREEWNRRQKVLAESAFQTILARQLEGATVLTEVFYQDISTGQWTEADSVIACDDVLVVIEAKAGIGAMYSPATHFGSHVRAIKSLIVKAYEQTERFFRYLASAPQVPIYHKRDGEIVEVMQFSLSSVRVAFPIGLTVESFAPFSAMCKELPALRPILRKHPFVSLSVDDLFVLNRFLPTAGEFFHYMAVRQQVAGIKGAQLFDEFDHLGAYIAKNRFDINLREQLTKVDRVTWDGFSDKIDAYFSRDRWQTESPPRQRFSVRLEEVLTGLERSLSAGWLAADATIRDLDDAGRAGLNATLEKLAHSLREHPRRWFATSGTDVATLFFWLYREGDQLGLSEVTRRAEISALASQRAHVCVICAAVDREGRITRAQTLQAGLPDPA